MIIVKNFVMKKLIGQFEELSDTQNHIFSLCNYHHIEIII